MISFILYLYIFGHVFCSITDFNNYFLPYIDNALSCSCETKTCLKKTGGSFGIIICDDDKNVISIDISNSSLSGMLHPNIGLMKHLTIFIASKNNLSGSIPKEIKYIVNLEVLDIGNNELIGMIPGELFMKSERDYVISTDVPPTTNFFSVSGSSSGSKALTSNTILFSSTLSSRSLAQSTSTSSASSYPVATSTSNEVLLPLSAFGPNTTRTRYAHSSVFDPATSNVLLMGGSKIKKC